MSLQPNSVRSLRQNRTSRYSSPASSSLHHNTIDTPPLADEPVSADVRQANGSAVITNKAQSRLDGWVEPKPQNTATFQEWGLDRTGYFEYMQPLGVPPSTKILQKLKLNFGAGKISGISRPSVTAAGDDSLRDTPGISDGLASPFVEAEAAGNNSEVEVDTNGRSPEEAEVPPDAAHVAIMEEAVLKPKSPKHRRSIKVEVDEMDYVPDAPLASTVADAVPRPTSRRSPSRTVKSQVGLSHEIAHKELQGAVDLARRQGSEELVAGIEYALRKHKPGSRISQAVENICLAQLDRLTFEHSRAWNHCVKKGIRRYRRQSEQATTTSIRSGSIESNIHTSVTTSGRAPRQISAIPATLNTMNRDGIVSSGESKSSQHERPQPFPSTFTAINNVSNQEERVGSHFQSAKNPSNDSSLQRSTDQPQSHKPRLVLRSPRKQRSESVSSTSSLSSARSITPAIDEMAVKTRKKTAPKIHNDLGPQQVQVVPKSASHSRGKKSAAVDNEDETDIEAVIKPQGQTVNAMVKKRKYNAKQSTIRKLSDEEQRKVDEEEQRLRARDFRDYQTKQWNGESNVRGYQDLPLTQNINNQKPPQPVVHPQAIQVPTSFTAISLSNALPSVNGDTHADNYLRSGRLESSPALSSPPLELLQPPAREVRKVSADETAATSSRGSTPIVTGKSGRVKRTAAAAAAHTTTQMYNQTNGTKSTQQDDISVNGDTGKNGLDDEEDDSHDICDYCHTVRPIRKERLICCDNCPNVYHFDHVEPKITRVPDGQWFCPDCRAERRPKSSAGPSDSMWDTLNENIDFEGLKSYKLPAKIRRHFAQVDTDEHGDYKDEPLPNDLFRQRILKQKRNGDSLHPFDYTQATTDTTPPAARICSQCGLGTENRRPIIPCDFCDNQFHFDCTNPTLHADPIKYGDKGTRISRWRCPRHVDQDLMRTNFVEVPEGLRGRRYKRRTPKDVSAVGSYATKQLQEVRQPIHNNGLIDVLLADSAYGQHHIPTGHLTKLNGAFHEEDSSQVEIIQKIPEYRLRMDFLAKAKQDFYDDAYNPRYQTIPGYRTQYRAKSWLPHREQYFDEDLRDESRPRLIKATNPHAPWLRYATKQILSKRKYDNMLLGQSTTEEQSISSDYSLGTAREIAAVVNGVIIDSTSPTKQAKTSQKSSLTKELTARAEAQRKLREQTPRAQSAIHSLIDFAQQDIDRLPLSPDAAATRIGGTMADLLRAGEQAQEEGDEQSLGELETIQRLLEKKIKLMRESRAARVGVEE